MQLSFVKNVVVPFSNVCIIQAMKFLYSQGFPTLGHVQTGNIFVVNDVCQLGGYENTLLGYESRLFGLCMDYLQHFDIILFGKIKHSQ